MNRISELQAHLAATGRYHGTVDGEYGPLTKAAILAAMEDGPDTALVTQDYVASGGRLGINPAYVMAFAEVEAAGAGFTQNFPKILFEPHRFSKMTGHRFDASHPTISYPRWGQRPYPRNTQERYQQLLKAVGLDVYAGFAAASYGKFQILGENFAACGYDTPYEFAFAMAYDEPTQLRAFERFLRETGILAWLKVGNWVQVAKRYNGPAYASHRYDVRLAQSARKWSTELEGMA